MVNNASNVMTVIYKSKCERVFYTSEKVFIFVLQRNEYDILPLLSVKNTVLDIGAYGATSLFN